jgi:hypothetical protein
LKHGQTICHQLLQRDDFSPEELFDCMRARLGMLSIDSIEKLGLPQPDIAIPKVRSGNVMLAACD